MLCKKQKLTKEINILLMLMGLGRKVATLHSLQLLLVAM